MREQQEQIIRDLDVVAVIDPSEQVRLRIDFMKDYLQAAGAKGFVLGISGGQDSTLLGALAQRAVNELRAEGTEAVFVAMRLPYGVQHDEDDAQAALAFIQPDETLVFNVKSAVDGLALGLEGEQSTGFADFTRGNSKARVRMVAQYAVAGERRLLVLGTDHAAEAVTGFFTKFGDGATDLNPLSGLTKGQGKELLAELGADARFWTKVPTADLLDGRPGQPDELELGLTYAQIDAYLTGQEVPEDVAEKIEGYYRRTQHKRHLPVVPSDTWWRPQA